MLTSESVDTWEHNPHTCLLRGYGVTPEACRTRVVDRIRKRLVVEPVEYCGLAKRWTYVLTFPGGENGSGGIFG